MESTHDKYDLDQSAYSVKELTKKLSLGKTKIYSLIASGKLKAVKVGNSTRLLRPDIVRCLDSLSGKVPTD